MIKSVIIVRNGLGSGCFVVVGYEGRAWRTDNAAACRAVDKREMRIEPAAPGSPEEVTYKINNIDTKTNNDLPLMTTANTAKPSYLLTNISRTIPVPLLIAIAMKSGDQPSLSNGRTR